jgi:hypothetical protein
MSNATAISIMYLTCFWQNYLAFKTMSLIYGFGLLMNNYAEWHFRARCIDKIYLVVPNNLLPDIISDDHKSSA